MLGLRSAILNKPRASLCLLGVCSLLRLILQQLLNGIAVWLSDGSGWVIISIDEHYTNTVVYDPLKGSSYQF